MADPRGTINFTVRLSISPYHRYMPEAHTIAARLEPQPLPENIRSVQPGGGFGYRVELAWGSLRRWYLKTFRRRYVQRMAALRIGSCDGCPHEILDPRDLKYCCNVCSCRWAEADDTFAWRKKIPFARWGMAELQIMGWPLLALAVFAGWFHWYLAIVPAVLLVFVVYFFRDPPRQIPSEPGCLVSPADGTVSEVAQIDYDLFLEGPAVRVSIFLSILNVHVNRSPAKSRVMSLKYAPGQFLNAMKAESALHNENMWIALEEKEYPYRRLVVRQVAGLIARRIVCALAPGEMIERGERFGMIKFGSRTELIMPADPDLVVLVRKGDKVKGGSTVLARYPK